MTTYTDAKYSINLPSGSGGSWIFLSSQTASNSASLSFTSGLDSTYKAYKFVFSNIHPRTDLAIFQFNFSTNSGSNYNVTKTTTFFRSQHQESGLSGLLEYLTGQDLAQSTSFQNLVFNCGSGSDENSSGTLLLFNPSSTTYVKHFISTFSDNESGVYGGYLTIPYIAGYGNTTSAVNAIQFKFDAGNFDGTIYLYGLTT